MLNQLKKAGFNKGISGEWIETECVKGSYNTKGVINYIRINKQQIDLFFEKDLFF